MIIMGDVREMGGREAWRRGAWAEDRHHSGPCVAGLETLVCAVRGGLACVSVRVRVSCVLCGGGVTVCVADACTILSKKKNIT